MSGLLRLTPGMVFARDFRVMRPLAEGGMGAVYVAEQLSTGKERAIKLMHPQLVNDTKSRERFAQEARAASLIESDHVVEVVAAGVDETTGAPWLAMEMLKGEELSTRLIRQGWLERSEAMEVFKQFCHGLGAAHRAGMVHRDLKPENIFLATPRRTDVLFTVKVLDFGIAKVTQEANRATLATGILGTPMWMAPEQIEAGLIRPCTDVWALGLIAFIVLTGRHYLVEANRSHPSLAGVVLEMSTGVLDSASVRARNLNCRNALPDGFDAWFARCVVRDPDARFANATDAFTALNSVLAPNSVRPSARSVEERVEFAATMALPVAAHGNNHSDPAFGSTIAASGSMPERIASAPTYAAPVPQPYPSEFAATRATPMVYAQATSVAPSSIPAAAQYAPQTPPTPMHFVANTPPISWQSGMRSNPAPSAKKPTAGKVIIGGSIAGIVIIAAIFVCIASSTNDDSTAAPTTAAATPIPFHNGERWTGQYSCAQGATDLVLHITEVQAATVNAIFDFRVPENGVTGQMNMSGTFDTSTRHLQLQPRAWINQPEGYLPLPLSLTVAPDESYVAASLEYPACAPFQLRREPATP